MTHRPQVHTQEDGGQGGGEGGIAGLYPACPELRWGPGDHGPLTEGSGGLHALWTS